jgi:hypothetical protein
MSLDSAHIFSNENISIGEFSLEWERRSYGYLAKARVRSIRGEMAINGPDWPRWLPRRRQPGSRRYADAYSRHR